MFEAARTNICLLPVYVSTSTLLATSPFNSVSAQPKTTTSTTMAKNATPSRVCDESLRRSFGTGVPFKHGLERCRNPRCKNGGYEIDQSLDEMVRGNLTEKEFETRCRGNEGAPRGKRPTRYCDKVLHYRLTIRYQSQGLPAS
jgi:hypothetical protein